MYQTTPPPFPTVRNKNPTPKLIKEPRSPPPTSHSAHSLLSLVSVLSLFLCEINTEPPPPHHHYQPTHHQHHHHRPHSVLKSHLHQQTIKPHQDASCCERITTIILPTSQQPQTASLPPSPVAALVRGSIFTVQPQIEQQSRICGSNCNRGSSFFNCFVVNMQKWPKALLGGSFKKQIWRFRRCESISWMKTNKSHALFQGSKEYCLMGIKGISGMWGIGK